MNESPKLQSNQWQEIIKRYEQSEQTQSQFCRDNGFKLSQFSYYLEKIRTKPKRKHVTTNGSTPTNFTPVSISSGSIGYQIFLPNGVRINLPHRFDVNMTKQLVEALS